MRTRRIFVAVAGAMMLTVGLAGPAAAQANNEHIRVVFGTNQPADGTFYGSGPISGTGVVHTLTNNTDLVRIKGKGTFVLAHHFTSHTPEHRIPGTCTFEFSDTGTFRISQGTGQFAGLVGHGTFTDEGTFTLQKKPGGGCEQNFGNFRVVARGAGYIHPET
jgi:hypothetical protein